MNYLTARLFEHQASDIFMLNLIICSCQNVGKDHKMSESLKK